MTFTLTQIFAILFFHFLFDFVFQSDKQAKGKSSNWNDLLSHTIIYSMSWWIPMIILIGNCTTTAGEILTKTLIFVVITFVTHTITDYITSREVKKLFEKSDTHNGFVLIGFDQFTHMVQLFLTFQYVLQ